MCVTYYCLPLSPSKTFKHLTRRSFYATLAKIFDAFTPKHNSNLGTIWSFHLCKRACFLTGGGNQSTWKK